MSSPPSADPGPDRNPPVHEAPAEANAPPGTNPPTQTHPPTTPQLPPEDAWLHDFYRECGREVTLAYTTLNQMKNWAIVIQAAIAAAVGALARPQVGGGRPELGPIVTIAGVLAWLFTLRFFIRAILCYTNLLRWNTLQRAVLQDRLDHPTAPLSNNLKGQIESHYFKWGATTSRPKQVLSTLKLGFTLLLLLPLAVTAWGVSISPTTALLRAVIAGAVAATMVEVYHYLRDAWFDDPEAAQRKSARPARFPGPSGAWGDLWGWFAVAVTALAAAAWPVLGSLIRCD